jgi:hypothetical protein
MAVAATGRRIMRRLHALMLTSLIFLLGAHPAFANAGTPLMWAGFCHLAFGNLLIGILEAFLLSRLFHHRMGRFVLPMIALPMIAANYVSAWIGFFILTFLCPSLPLDIYNVDLASWIAAFAFYFLTALLESLFVGLSLRGTGQGCKDAVRGSFLIHLVSYGLLFGWYWIAGGRPLGQSAKVVPPASLPLPSSVTLYYIGAEDGDVYRLSPNAAPVRIYPLHSVSNYDRLFARPLIMSIRYSDLTALLAARQSAPQRYVTILPEFAAPSTVWIEDDPKDTSMNIIYVPSLASSTETRHQYSTGFWPNEGLHISDARTKQTKWLTCDTPLANWMVRNAVQLSDDLVLFQFGDNQICLYDADSERLSLVARGRGPVAVVSISPTVPTKK